MDGDVVCVLFEMLGTTDARHRRVLRPGRVTARARGRCGDLKVSYES